jgi:TolB-like protein/Tfp pilus assembly protein PilF
LLALVEKRGEVVAKDRLMKMVWPDTFVEESNLTANISILRKQLGTRAEGGEYIETIPKRGYRFVQAVRQVQDQNGSLISTRKPSHATMRRAIIAAAAGISILTALYLGLWRVPLTGVGAAHHIASLAVLPLANLSGDAAQDYFADGITEALTNDLAQIGSLKVISRISVMQYKNTKKTLRQIADELKVDAVVVGSAVRSGERVRVTAELIHARSDRHLWARTYDSNLGDVLDLENELAQAIASGVQAKVTLQEQHRLSRNQRVNSAAYEAYLKGRHYWNQATVEPLHKSIEQLQEAITLDPGYAASYAGLADAWIGLYRIGAVPYDEAYANVSAAATKALQLDDTLAEAHTAMATVKAMERDWAAALRENRKAIELNPGYATAHVFYSNRLRHLGFAAQSISEAKRALELDPLSPMANNELADAYLSARQYDFAIEQYEKTLELYPDRAESRDGLGWAYAFSRKYDLAIEEIKRSYGEDPELSPELAYVYAMRGQRDKSLRILNRLRRFARKTPVAAHHFALIYAGLDRRAEALDCLEEAYREHSPMMNWLKVDPRFDRLRPDPRFQEILRRVGLL